MVFGFGGGKPSEERVGVSEALRLARKRAAALIADNALALARAPRRQSAPSYRAYPSPQLAGGHAPVPRLTPQEHASLATAPRRDGKIGPVDIGDAVGNLLNVPNTVAGLTYGYMGQGVGELAYRAGRQKDRPRVVRSPGKTEFLDNPFGGVGAITIGDTTTYHDDPYSPEGRESWAVTEGKEGHPVWEHEGGHMKQARDLGPLYLPSNLLGGLNASAHGQDWHGDANWNERGPKLNPPRAWAPRRSR
jgi:hypothetical protein